MPDELFILHAPTSDYVELANTPKGKLFKKQILKYGSFHHPSAPNKVLNVDRAYADKLIQNFNSGVVGPVQFPVIDPSGAHTEDPLRNLGEVMSVEADAEGVNVILDVRKLSGDIGNTILDCSATISADFLDKRTGKRVGPALKNVNACNNPYLNDLKPYEEVMAEFSDISNEKLVALSLDDVADPEETAQQPNTSEVGTNKKEDDMTLEEMLADLKSKHNIDVPALQASAAKVEESETKVAELSAKVEEQDAQIVELTNAAAGSEDDDEVRLSALTNQVVALRDDNVVLATAVKDLKESNDAMKLSNAEHEVDALVTAGRVLPAQRDALVKLSLSDREMFDALVPTEPVVDLSEIGSTTVEERDAVKRASDLVDGYLKLANK